MHLYLLYTYVEYRFVINFGVACQFAVNAVELNVFLMLFEFCFNFNFRFNFFVESGIEYFTLPFSVLDVFLVLALFINRVTWYSCIGW